METGIKSWSKEDRPREKMMEKGAWALSNSELLAILLSSGNKKESAVDLARRILSDCQQQLKRLSKHTVQSLSKYEGIGPAKAVTLLAALELGNRSMSEVKEKQQICNSKDIFMMMHPLISGKAYEECWVLFLDASNGLITSKKISDGGITSCSVDAKKIMKMALEELAVSVILCHNHPSGSILPSEEDKKLTAKIKNICQVMEINFLDHVIIGNNRYYSFADSSNIL